MAGLGKPVTDAGAGEKVAAADRDGDGRVGFEEYVGMMMPAVMELIQIIQ
jgi:hypothetical protein